MVLPRAPRFTALGFVIVAALLLLAFIVPNVVRIVRAFKDHAGLAISQAHVQVSQDLRTLTETGQKGVVPKVIHQIVHNWDDPDNEEFPASWDHIRQTISYFNPDYEHKLWTVSSSRIFLEENYPWILTTYDTLPYAIQKVDVMKYFLMRHFGGIYMDLDTGCLANLDGLLYFSAWVLDGANDAISNKVMGAQPNHPFWIMVTENIQTFARDYFSEDLTINLATGTWFQTLMWAQYHRRKPKGAPDLTRIRVDHGLDGEGVFMFTLGKGALREVGDTKWISRHLSVALPLAALATVALTAFVGLVWKVVPRSSRPRQRRYSAVATKPDEEESKAD